MMQRNAFTVVEFLVILVILFILAGLFPTFTPFSAFWFSVLVCALLLAGGLALYVKRWRKTTILPLVAAGVLFAYNAPTIPLMNADNYAMSGQRYVDKPLSEVLASEAGSGSMPLPVRFWVDTSLASEEISIDTRDMQLGDFLSLLNTKLGSTSDFRWKSGCCGGICNPYAASVTLVSGTPRNHNDPAYDRCLVYIDQSGIEDFSTVIEKGEP